MKLTRYSGKRHNADLAAWLRRCLFKRPPPTLGTGWDGGRVVWTHRGKPRETRARKYKAVHRHG